MMAKAATVTAVVAAANWHGEMVLWGGGNEVAVVLVFREIKKTEWASAD